MHDRAERTPQLGLAAWSTAHVNAGLGVDGAFPGHGNHEHRLRHPVGMHARGFIIAPTFFFAPVPYFRRHHAKGFAMQRSRVAIAAGVVASLTLVCFRHRVTH
jgi:hypothetical protein